MRKLIFAIVLIIVLPLAFAVDKRVEGPYDFGSFEADVSVSSSLLAVEEGSDAKLQSLEADLIFVPFEAPSQLILESVTKASPYATIDAYDTGVKFSWSNPREDFLSYRSDSKVKVDNSLVKVYKKNTFPLKFPVQTLGTNYTEYTKPTEFIDVNDEIRRTATDIIEGETDYYRAVFKIADWVGRNVNYTLDTMTADMVQKSSWVLENKEGVCDEITNLFISLCRAAGIPARFIGGVVYSNIAEDFGTHGWAEVYFPAEGWVPVDVTFSQVGWMDPTHIKMHESTDSGDPSVNYKWKARGISFKMNPLTVEVANESLKGTFSSLSRMSIEPLRDEVAPGSYMPVQVRIENFNDFYLPLAVRVKKAPGLVEKNGRAVLLEPHETKDLFWTVIIPPDAEKNMLYTTFIELEDQYGTTASGTIKYALGNEQFTEDWAIEQVQRLAPREEKSFLHNVGFSCTTDKDHYYREDVATVTCEVANMGNTRLTGLRVCHEADCRIVDLEVGESKPASISITLEGKEAGKIRLTAETKNLVKGHYVDIDIVNVPDLRIEAFGPEAVGYRDDAKFSLLLNTTTTAYDTEISINDFWTVEVGNLSIPKEFVIPFKPRKAIRGDINITVSFNDRVGKRYELRKDTLIKVNKIPLLTRFILWIESFF